MTRLTSNDIKSSLSGELFSSKTNPIFELPEVKSYWKTRYGKYMKYRDDGNVTIYAMANDKLVPLAEYEKESDKTTLYDNGQEIDHCKFLEKVRSIIAFI